MRRQLSARPDQSGFAIVTAIFIIVALAALAAAIVSLVRTEQTGSILDTEGTRAYQAARSGVEWGAYNSMRNNTCTPTTPVAFGSTLGAYIATVTCTRTAHNEGGTAVNIDTIVATACNQPAAGNCPNPAPGAGYAERQISIMVGN